MSQLWCTTFKWRWVDFLMHPPHRLLLPIYFVLFCASPTAEIYFGEIANLKPPLGVSCTHSKCWTFTASAHIYDLPSGCFPLLREIWLKWNLTGQFLMQGTVAQNCLPLSFRCLSSNHPCVATAQFQEALCLSYYRIDCCKKQNDWPKLNSSPKAKMQ